MGLPRILSTLCPATQSQVSLYIQSLGQLPLHPQLPVDLSQGWCEHVNQLYNEYLSNDLFDTNHIIGCSLDHLDVPKITNSFHTGEHYRKNVSDYLATGAVKKIVPVHIHHDPYSATSKPPKCYSITVAKWSYKRGMVEWQSCGRHLLLLLFSIF